MQRFRRLALASAVATLVLVALGGLVRATGSGLGCLDDWPTCRGGWVAPLEYHALIEYAHRAVAGIVALLLVGQALAVRRWAPGERVLRRWSDAAVGIVIVQALVGRVVVTEDLHAAVVTGHFVLAMALVAVTTLLAAGAFLHGSPPARDEERGMAGMALGAVGGTAVLLLVGAYVREFGAGLAFADWPLMGGSILPSFGSADRVLHFLHRLLALLLFGHVGAMALRARGDGRRAVRLLAGSALGVFVVQVGVGAVNVLTRLAPAAVMLHVALSALTWALLVALAVAARRGPVLPARHSPAERLTGAQGAEGATPQRGGRFMAYVRLTKPRIIFLLLVTTVPAMVLAAGGLPSIPLVGATLLGGMLTAGSANAINQVLERDIDAKMERTKSRPLPMSELDPRRALVFAVSLGVIGFGWLWWTANLLAASLAVGAILFYVGVYTVWLKRSTPQNIVIGGAAGAVPVLVGWAAVTGSLALPAWILFAIVFFWTPPHFWALAVRYKDDYAAAGVPMLPVARGVVKTKAQILVYSALLVPLTLLLSPAAGMGVAYLVVAGVLGAVFLYLAFRLWQDPSAEVAMRLFKYSISYLTLLFGAIAVDGAVL